MFIAKEGSSQNQSAWFSLVVFFRQADTTSTNDSICISYQGCPWIHLESEPFDVVIVGHDLIDIYLVLPVTPIGEYHEPYFGFGPFDNPQPVYPSRLFGFGSIHFGAGCELDELHDISSL